MRILLSAFVFMVALSGCNGQETLDTWNQRMTVTVDTPDGPVSGSTVYEVGAVVPANGGRETAWSWIILDRDFRMGITEEFYFSILAMGAYHRG